ncbi:MULTISPECIES: DUF202 domain-containing protein [Algoriphagus]|jgi:putative membrane protein|uniref:Putative membrane protein n=1 Tax=Algoriphagus zhangzhouensis TaxID=1073327 RepID=A0A1M7Z3H5_9BACT|nr:MULTISPECIES: DUF202 domain-containing protein [Algoriphagus]TDY48441.1 putative membrane protein [Algoriphagus zhangzhouensis]SHO59488.1 putative membrane protein [Algoriphagus zhangzhouensis]
MEKDFENELIIRDFLARQRTTLANQRTLLTYIRTSLYFLVSGTALFEVEHLNHIRDFGYLAFVLSAVFLVLGFYSYFSVRSKLKKGNYHKM